MFTIAEGKEIELVAGEHPVILCKIVQLIEVNIKHKDVVMEPVNFWFEAVVHYAGFIEARVHVAIFPRIRGLRGLLNSFHHQGHKVHQGQKHLQFTAKFNSTHVCIFMKTIAKITTTKIDRAGLI